jgi:biotin-dependent carboxylase-like uncharacterized protein
VTLRILHPGMLSTVQDLGRPGLAALGISPCGAADHASLRIGNRLVGNPDRAAALEMTLLGAEVRAEAPMLIALAGSAPSAAIDSPNGPRTLAPCTSTPLDAGEVLRIGPLAPGARAYLCIAGGIATPIVLGSRSTHPASGIGGLDGRPIRRGDGLPIGQPPSAPSSTTSSTPAAGRTLPPIAREALQTHLSRRALRITRGPHADLFPAGAWDSFLGAVFTVSEQSDRTGLRLAGPPIPSPFEGRMTTEPMPPGAIQITEAGMPILLGPDRPTTGGYPVIACIASVDLPALGQLRPRDRLRFQPVAVDEARRLLGAFEDELDRLLPPAAPGASP